MEKQLATVLSKMVGLELQEVIAGGSNGSVVVLRFGRSQFTMFVYSVWRLEYKGKIISGWNESNDAINGTLTKAVKSIQLQTLKSYSISEFYDLRLSFSNEMILNIFCDITPNYEPSHYDKNWMCCDIKANICYIVNKDFKVELTEYD